MQNKDRLYLNAAKGIAVFLMLWGHCIQYCAMDSFNFFENAVYKTIYSFHMPLFMLISGYLYFFSFRKRDLKNLLIHRTQSLVQTIVFGAILYNLLMKLMQLAVSGSVELFDGSLFSGYTLLWFLWCVLSSSLAVGIACKITENGLLQGVLLLAGAFLVALFPEKDFHLFMYPFFVVGFFCAKYKTVLIKLLRKLEYLSLILFPVMLCFYNWRHYIYLTPIYSPEYGLVGSLKIDIFRFAIGLAGSAFVLTVLDLVFRAAVSGERVPRLLTAISKLGENSLQIYCLSAPLLSGYLPVVYQKLVSVVGYNVFAENQVVYDLIFTPLLAAAYSAGLYGVVLAMKKLKIHGLIFGR